MLKDLVVHRKEWESVKEYIGDKESEPVKLRGLSTTDISKILATNRKSFSDLFEGRVSLEEAIFTFPNMIAHVIALSAGEEEHWQEVLKLPAGVQLEALDIIWELSHIGEDNLGKLFAGLADLMEKWRGETNQVSENGSSVSHEPSSDSGKVVGGV